MDINNIALVRATNYIPFDGKIKTVSNSVVLNKRSSFQYAYSIGDFLEQDGRIPTFEQVKQKMIEKGEISKDADFIEVFEKCSERSASIKRKVTSDYLPYLCEYNSMVLFSINGLVPDDNENGGMGGNIFSDKDCAIIDGLKEHIKDVISLNPTDTAIKGNVILSPNAIILISQNRYKTLTDEEKIALNNLSCQKIIFNGTLKEAVQNTLEESERYTSEELTLSRRQIKPSETSDELVEVLNKIAEERGLSQAYHFDVIFNRTDMIGGLESVKDEVQNINMISDYYMNQFYFYIFEKMDIDEGLQYSLVNFKDAKPYVKELLDKIEKYGIDNYRKLVINYNTALRELKNSGKLPTPEEILESLKDNKSINIAKMVEEQITGIEPSAEFGIPNILQKKLNEQFKLENDKNRE